MLSWSSGWWYITTGLEEIVSHIDLSAGAADNTGIIHLFSQIEKVGG